jgi:hypothetical protein
MIEYQGLRECQLHVVMQRARNISFFFFERIWNMSHCFVKFKNGSAMLWREKHFCKQCFGSGFHLTLMLLTLKDVPRLGSWSVVPCTVLNKDLLSGQTDFSQHLDDLLFLSQGFKGSLKVEILAFFVSAFDHLSKMWSIFYNLLVTGTAIVLFP